MKGSPRAGWPEGVAAPQRDRAGFKPARQPAGRVRAPGSDPSSTAADQSQGPITVRWRHWQQRHAPRASAHGGPCPCQRGGGHEPAAHFDPTHHREYDHAGLLQAALCRRLQTGRHWVHCPWHHCCDSGRPSSQILQCCPQEIQFHAGCPRGYGPHVEHPQRLQAPLPCRTQQRAVMALTSARFAGHPCCCLMAAASASDCAPVVSCGLALLGDALDDQFHRLGAQGCVLWRSRCPSRCWVSVIQRLYVPESSFRLGTHVQVWTWGQEQALCCGAVQLRVAGLCGLPSASAVLLD